MWPDEKIETDGWFGQVKVQRQELWYNVQNCTN